MKAKASLASKPLPRTGQRNSMVDALGADLPSREPSRETAVGGVAAGQTGGLQPLGLGGSPLLAGMGEKPKEARKTKADKVWEQDLDEDDKAAL